MTYAVQAPALPTTCLQAGSKPATDAAQDWLCVYGLTHSDGSPGGSNCTMVVTDGKSKPRAATSVLSSTPASHFVKSRNVAVRTLCSEMP